MNLLGKIGRMIRAEINSFIETTEDPEKLLEQGVAQMEQELIEMRRALAAAIATHKGGERQLANHKSTAQKWYERAQLALDKGNEALAKEALTHRQSYLVTAQSLQTQLEQQRGIIGKVKQDLSILERHYAEARAKKSLYIARLRSATTSQKLQEIMGNVNSGSSLNIFERVETKILELEAQSELMTVSQSDPLEQKFAALEGDNNVETELAKLKAEKLDNSYQSTVRITEKGEMG